ncbi:hypothetical protein J4526_09190 [Desulfurococcaceae archaeon MEX13E-LK6-19]|nr:hypothetical protein J4526_09190 [Desulfurococcaceae archaeon MEX13E-LK6-19]
MDVELKEYGSFTQFLEDLKNREKAIREHMSVLKELMETVKQRAEAEEKLINMLKNIIGEDKFFGNKMINVNGMRIIINPGPRSRYTLLEETYRRLNKVLEGLAMLMGIIDKLAKVDVEVKITVFYENGLPKDIIVDF